MFNFVLQICRLLSNQFNLRWLHLRQQWKWPRFRLHPQIRWRSLPSSVDFCGKTIPGSWLSWSQCCFQFWHNKWLSLNCHLRLGIMSHLIPDHLTYPRSPWPVFSLRVMMGTVTQIVARPKIKTRTNINVTASYWPVLMTQSADWSRYLCCLTYGNTLMHNAFTDNLYHQVLILLMTIAINRLYGKISLHFL